MKFIQFIAACALVLFSYSASAQVQAKGTLFFPADVTHTLADDMTDSLAIYLVDGGVVNSPGDTTVVSFMIVVDEKINPASSQDSLATELQVFQSQILASQQVYPDNYKRTYNIFKDYFDKKLNPPSIIVTPATATRDSVANDPEIPTATGKKIKKTKKS